MPSEKTLPATRVQSIVPRSILAWLCHYANADPSHCRNTFYDLKDRLLRQYAEFRGHDIQEIVKECYGGFDYIGDPRGCKGKECRRCGGTGIYDRRWVRLQRWHWGKYVFHIPDGSTWIKPDSVQIHGRIKHEDYGKASRGREAELWLYIVTLQFGMWWKVLSTSSYCSPGWWPMCRLQGWAMWARMKFSWHRCWCGKRFPTWGTGWQICKKCRQPKTVTEQDDDMPF
jgi:hypothetical protein